MQDFNWLEFMYDNFMLVFYLALFCIIFVLAFSGWIIKHQIGTKVLISRKTTAEMKSAKEDIGKGTVKIGKTLYKREGEPTYMSSLLRPYRLYVHFEGSDKVLGLNSLIKTDDTKLTDEAISNSAFQALLESEVIQQSVRGLVGSLLEKLVYLGAGGFIGIIIFEILRGLFS